MTCSTASIMGMPAFSILILLRFEGRDTLFCPELDD
jgi:hypothetical protein